MTKQKRPTFTAEFKLEAAQLIVDGDHEGKGSFTYADGTTETGYFVDDKYWGTVAEWGAKVAKENLTIKFIPPVL